MWLRMGWRTHCGQPQHGRTGYGGERHAIFSRRCSQRQLLPTTVVHVYTKPIDFADCRWKCSSTELQYVRAMTAIGTTRNCNKPSSRKHITNFTKSSKATLLRMPTGANNKHTNCLILWFQSKAATSYIQRKTNHWSNMLHSTIWRINWNSGSCLLY